MKLVLHIGLHRAASSSIQELLHSHQDALQREGIAAVTQTMAVNEPFRVFKQLRGHMVERRGLAPLTDDLLRWLEQRAGQTECLTFSDENMPGFMPGKRAAAFAHADGLAAIVGGLKAYHDVQVLCVLREHVGYLHSVHNYRRARTATAGFPAFVSTLELASIDFSGLLDTVAGAVGQRNLHVRDFRCVPDSGGRELVDALAGLSGSSCLKDARLPQANRSADEPELAVIEALNAQGIFVPFGAPRRKLLAALRAGPAAHRDDEASAVFDSIRGEALQLGFAISSERRLRAALQLTEKRVIGLTRSVTRNRVVKALAQAARPAATAADDRRTDFDLWQRFAGDRRNIARNWLPGWQDLAPPAQ